MSTRCQIGFYDNKPETAKDLKNFEALIYKHSDGYPEGVIPCLKEFILQYPRNDQVEYQAARFLQFLTNEHDQSHLDFMKKNKFKPSEISDFNAIGFGICKEFHGDIEYFYAVSCVYIQVYRVPIGSEPEQWERIDEVFIKDVPYEYMSGHVFRGK